MNLLFFLESSVSGLLAGIITWLVYRNGNPWDLLQNFQSGLLTSGVFCGLFTSLVSALPILIMERRFSKVANYMLSGFVISFSITALGGVIYSLLIRPIISPEEIIPTSVLRFLWWFLLAICISLSFGFLNSSFKAFCKTLMGLTPSFIIAGALSDKLFNTDSKYMLSFIFMGFIIGMGHAIAQEILKEAWLDEYKGFGITFRYYLSESDFSAGSSDENDMTLKEGPELLFLIKEKDGVNIFELQTKTLEASVNKSKFRYRALVDGDKINIPNHEIVYHTKFSHIRDEMPALS